MLCAASPTSSVNTNTPSYWNETCELELCRFAPLQMRVSSISFSYLTCSSSFGDSLCLSKICWLIPASDAQQTQRDAMESHTSGENRGRTEFASLVISVLWHLPNEDLVNQCLLTFLFWRSWWCGLRDMILMTAVKCRQKKAAKHNAILEVFSATLCCKHASKVGIRICF